MLRHEVETEEELPPVPTEGMRQEAVKVKELEERFSATRKFVDMRLEGIQLKVDLKNPDT